MTQGRAYSGKIECEQAEREQEKKVWFYLMKTLSKDYSFFEKWIYMQMLK